MDYVQWAKDTFCEDKFATELTGIEIVDVKTDYAKCKLDVTRLHRNVTGMVMGGAIFTLADFAFAIAANAENAEQGDAVTVTLSAQIQYLGAGRGDQLIAEAICVKSGRSTSCYEVTVTDDRGSLIAKVTCTGFKTKR